MTQALAIKAGPEPAAIGRQRTGGQRRAEDSAPMIRRAADRDAALEAPPGSCPCGGGCPGCTEQDSVSSSKLRAEGSGDAFEHEADRGPEPADLERRIVAGLMGPHARATSPQDEAARATASRSGGEPLAHDARTDMERRFGYDLGRIRVHRDSQSAAALGAKALASDQDIWFGPGHDPSDRTLLAHEVAHVVQQALGRADGLHGATDGQAQRMVLEREADHWSRQVPDAPHAAFVPLRQLPPFLPSPSMVQFDFDQDVRRELHRLPSAEEEGLAAGERRRREDVISGRRARLRTLFASLSPAEAGRVHERLRVRRPGDNLSERFHDILAGPTRQELLDILQRTSSPTPPYGPGPAQAPRSPLLEQIDDRLHPDVGAQLEKDERLRQSLLTLYARIGDLWTFVPRYDPAKCKTKSEEACGITWIDPINGIVFHLDDEVRLQKRLKSDGYTSEWLAKSGDDRWGLREPGATVAGLHWRGLPKSGIGVHIDLHPPGATPELHFVLDKLLREKTHTPETLRQGVERRGVEIPVLAEQEFHGRLTTRFTELQSTMGGQPGARARLAVAKKALDDAAAIIWTRAVVTDAQLAGAIQRLRDAAKELDQLEHVAAPPAPTAPR